MTITDRWWYAVKPKSWPKLLVPALLGQALGATARGGLDWRPALVGLGLTLGLLLYIVLLNDYGDREVDAIKRRMFPEGCSPKTIPDGILPARSLRDGGLLGGGAAVGFAILGQLWLHRPGLALATGGALLVFVAYTFPPLRLNYRGGGELLEALGVGALLPWLQAYLQGGSPWHPSYLLLAGFSGMSLASALASGLSDERSDREGGKRTCATWIGNRFTRRASEASLALGAGAWLAATLAWPAAAPRWCVLPALVVVGVNGALLLFASDRATTDAFAAQGIYKRYLHRAIWHGAALLALLMLSGL